MIRLVADWGTYGLWILSTREAISHFLKSGDFNLNSMSFAVSALGIVWTVVRIVNSVLDGRVNREKTRLESERISLELWELEDIDDINERHK